MKIKDIIKTGESETAEFKNSLSNMRDIIETISAFSNTLGGIILIGVDDKRNIYGVNIGKNTIESIANKIKQNTDPQIYPSISIKKINNKQIIVIKMNESSSKPVFAFDRVYKRVGKSNHRVSSDEIRKMAAEIKEIYWDEQLCEDGTLNDIDWEFVENSFMPLYENLYKSKVTGSVKEFLTSLGGIKKEIPTNAGILLFGKNPQAFFINSYIALARYKGKTEDVIRLDYKEFVGNIFQQIDNCDKYINDHISIMSRALPNQVQRQDISEYGLYSIRELLTNAVCHRDYLNQHTKIIIKMFSDRIEFYNPGGLPKDITPENITEKQYSRNPIIAKALARVRYIEELGEGWNKIIKEHNEHVLKPKVPINVIGVCSHNIDAVKTLLDFIYSWVKLFLFILTAIVGGSAVT